MKNFFVIFNAVVFANICTLVLYETYLSVKERTQTEIEHAIIETVPDRRAAEPVAIVEAATPQADSKALQAKETLRKTKRMCDYWTNQHNKEPIAYNQALRDKSCLKYNKLLATMPSEE